MKTFNQLVEDNGETAEIVPTVKKKVNGAMTALKDRLLKRRRKAKYLESVAHIEKTYPGVNHFFLTASEWAEFVDPIKNPKLYKLLIELSKPVHLQDFSEAELRRVYKYIFNRHLKTQEDMKREFISAAKDYSDWSGPERRDIGGEYDGPERRGDRKKLKSFSHFKYKGVDTKTMKVISKKATILEKMAKNLTPANINSVLTVLTQMLTFYMIYKNNEVRKEVAALKNALSAGEAVKNAQTGRPDIRDSAMGKFAKALRSFINIVLGRDDDDGDKGAGNFMHIPGQGK